MSFVDKLFRWKKKPFRTEAARVTKEPKVTKVDEPRGTGKYAHVLLRPHTSEKAVGLAALNQYVFEVNPAVKKQEVDAAIRDLYGVAPLSVNMVNMQGKAVRFGRATGATKGWKKAIITLPPGKTIDVYKK